MSVKSTWVWLLRRTPGRAATCGKRVMTMDTGKLIEHLVEASGPVRRLARPWQRTLVWLTIVLPYIALVVIVVSPRSDLVTKVSELRFVIEQTAALVVGI